MASQSSAFEKLPNELRVAILSECTDLDSLKFLSLSCRSFYAVYKNDEAQICQRLLVKIGLDVGLFHDALAVEESARHCRHTSIKWTRRERHYFIDKYMSPELRPFETSPWRWSLAARVAGFHRVVSTLAAGFIATCSAVLAQVGATLPSQAHQLSANEIRRIHQIFYRLALYANTFGRFSDAPFTMEEQLRAFFTRFAPWENEQLACVHYHLCIQVLNVLRTAALTRTSWIEWFACVGGGVLLSSADEIISRGLENVLELLSSFQAGRELPSWMEPDCDTSAGDFLTMAFSELSMGRDHSSCSLEDMSEADIEIWIVPAAFPDPDLGPRDVWTWAHQQNYTQEFVGGESQGCLRAWGYVFWDRSTLSQLNIPWHEDWDSRDQTWLAGAWDDLEYPEERTEQLQIDIRANRLAQDRVIRRITRVECGNSPEHNQLLADGLKCTVDEQLLAMPRFNTPILPGLWIKHEPAI